MEKSDCILLTRVLLPDLLDPLPLPVSITVGEEGSNIITLAISYKGACAVIKIRHWYKDHALKPFMIVAIYGAGLVLCISHLRQTVPSVLC